MAAVAAKVGAKAAAAGLRWLLGRLAAAVRAAVLWLARSLETFGCDGSPSVVPDDGSGCEEDRDERGETKVMEEVPTKERMLAACISRACQLAKRANGKLTEVRGKAKTRLRERMNERRERKHQRTREQAV